MASPVQDIGPDAVTGDGSVRRPTLTLDVALYDEYLAGSDLGEAQKRDLLEALWAIIVGFVDLGFAVEPAIALSDMPDGESEELAPAGCALVDLPANSTTGHFEKAAAHMASSDH